MNADLRTRLSLLPELGGRTSKSQTIACKICGSASRFFDVTDFQKCGGGQYDFYRFGMSGIPVYYYRCTECRFVFTDFFDEWTPSDFSAFIYNQDYYKVDPEYREARPKRCAANIASALSKDENSRLLDYGSGAGVFAQEMRALGFPECIDYDPFSSPVRPQGKFDVITCFEVMEHTPTPIGTLMDVASFLDESGILIFSTGVQPPEFEQQKANWWYVSPRNGHMSIHSRQSLTILASKAGLEYVPQAYGFDGMRRA